MATQTTGGGSTTSFTNAPQANGDTYNFLEEELRTNASLYNDSSDTIFLNVLSNDLGGAAKSLFSIDDGEGALTELLQSNVTTGWEQTSDGNWIRINAGKIEFRIGDGSDDPNSIRDVNSLGQGEQIDDTFLYAIRMANGTIAYATVHITITGSNDGPEALADEASVDEDGNTSGNVGSNDSDPDAGAVLSYALDAPGSAPAGLVFNSDGSWTFDASSYDYLDEGEELELVIPYTVTDEHGASDSSTLTITITGINDIPVALADQAAVDEDGNTSGTVATNDSDADAGAVLGYALVDPSSAPVGLVFNTDGSWTFDASSYDSLDEGEELELVIPYTVTDDHGASDSSTLTITVTGVNDAPLLTGTQATLPAGTEDTSYIVSAASLLAGFTDADGDTLAVFALSADHGSVTDNGDGTYTINPAADYNGLVTLSYSVVDGNGGSVPASLSFNLAAVNDPAVIAGPITGTVVEATPADPGTPTASGTLTAADVDNPPNTFIAVASTATATGYGSYTMSASGLWTYTLNNGNATVNALATGAFLIDTFTVQSADGTTQTITVTIDGATDAVVVTPPATYNGLDSVNDHDSDLGTNSASNPLITGTIDNDDIDGRTTGSGADTINALAGDDIVHAGDGGDNVYGGSGSDTIYGGSGNDALYGQAGDDFLYGESNNDQLFGGSGNDYLDGGDNSDMLLSGGSGNDTILGGINDDVLIGGYGADTLTGGAGNDNFVYFDLKDTNDTILDFMDSGNDQIDLSALDANGALGGDQAFGWGGTTPTANSLWFSESGGNTTLFGDTDGNVATAEFMISLPTFSGFAIYGSPLTPPPDITF